MSNELAQQWPFNNLCKDHINAEENEHLMRGKVSAALILD